MRNRLANATSAFLRAASSHAIDWRPFDSAAFAAAAELDRPVLLDIGAAWCHYCHVMDEQCYQNSAIANFINERFIAIRVDCDARPDIDARYQACVAQLTGLGGWPLTAFLTPDGSVFYGGTFFPLRPAGSQPGFLQILTWAAELYKSGPAKRAEEGRRLRETLAARLGHHRAAAPDPGDPATRISNLVKQTIGALSDSIDRRNGGFGDTPKFLFTSPLRCMIRAGAKPGNTLARDFVLFTLQQMLRGGVYDRVAGGFHRYATDDRFEIPHFEKLACQNAEMLEVLCEASVFFENHPALADAGVDAAMAKTARYLIDQLRLPSGAFAASHDAGASGREGDPYTWTTAELQAALGPTDHAIAEYIYQLDPSGTFSDRRGRQILTLRVPAAAAARKWNCSIPDAQEKIQQIEETLRAARAARPQAQRDETVIPAWSALAAAALFTMGRISGDKGATNAATAACEALARIESEGGLPLRAGCPVPLLADAAALAELWVIRFEATGSRAALDQASALLQKVVARFAGKDGLFSDRPVSESAGNMGPAGSNWAVVPLDDSPHASATAIALRALCRYLSHEEDGSLRELSIRCASALATRISQADPLASAAGTLALADFARLQARGLQPFHVVVQGGDNVAKREMVRTALRAGIPVVLIQATESELVNSLAAIAAPFRDAAGVVALVCEGNRCHAPAHDPGSLAERLRSLEAKMNSHQVDVI